jgi:hypothetical protein
MKKLVSICFLTIEVIALGFIFIVVDNRIALPEGAISGFGGGFGRGRGVAPAPTPGRRRHPRWPR